MVLWELLEHKVPFDTDTEVDSASKIKAGEVRNLQFLLVRLWPEGGMEFIAHKCNNQ